MKKSYSMMLCIGLMGCSFTSTPATATLTSVTIIDVYKDSGCHGLSEWKTTVITDDKRISIMCDKLGNVGDKIVGCWVSNSNLNSDNGFHTTWVGECK